MTIFERLGCWLLRRRICHHHKLLEGIYNAAEAHRQTALQSEAPFDWWLYEGKARAYRVAILLFEISLAPGARRKITDNSDRRSSPISPGNSMPGAKFIADCRMQIAECGMLTDLRCGGAESWW